MAAQMEDEKYADRNYGRLLQLNFGKSSEVNVINDNFKLMLEEPKKEEQAAKKEVAQVMLQDIVDGKTEGILRKYSGFVFIN